MSYEVRNGFKVWLHAGWSPSYGVAVFAEDFMNALQRRPVLWQEAYS